MTGKISLLQIIHKDAKHAIWTLVRGMQQEVRNVKGFIPGTMRCRIIDGKYILDDEILKDYYQINITAKQEVDFYDN